MSILQKQFPIIESNIDGLSQRLELLISFTKRDRIDPSGQERVMVYEKFMNNFSSFFPAGEKNYKPYPHNQFMEIIMRWGLFGLPLLFLSVKLYLKSFKHVNVNNYTVKPVATIIIVLFLFSYFQSMTSLSLEMNRMLWLGFGFLISYKK